MMREESIEDSFLVREELVRVGAQSGEITAVVFDLGKELANQVHEVLMHDTDDMEAIGDDLGVWEVPADKSPVGATQVHADEADVFFALQSGEVGFKVLGFTAFDDVEDLVCSLIAERSGEAGAATISSSLPVDRMFVDAEDGRTDSVGVFASFTGGVFVVKALDGSCADTFSLGKDAACDAIAVEFVDRSSKWLGGVAILFDTR